MKFIGITGGVGAGKSQVLKYLKQKNGVQVVLADEVARDLMEPGGDCYAGILQLFQTHGIAKADMVLADGGLNRPAIAKALFQEESLRQELNAYVHPAVKDTILRLVEQARQQGDIQWFFVEAALLIEEHYDEVCDDLWYIYTSEENRRLRLQASRGYSIEKIQSIMEHQQSEDTFRRYCKVWIDNNGDFSNTKSALDRAMA